MPTAILAVLLAASAWWLVQHRLMRRVCAILENRHSDVWRDLSAKAFTNSAVFNFVWKKLDRGVGDHELTAAAVRMRKLQLVALAILVGYLAALFVSFGCSKP